MMRLLPLGLFLALPTLTRTAASSDPDIGCTSAVNVTEIYSAGAALGDYCVTHGPISRETKVSWTLGSTRVYACNYSKTGTNPCSIAEIAAAWDQIQGRCGTGVGGWWYQRDWKKTYGFDNVNADWCGNMWGGQ
ncbi:hypothetical protein OQA88_2432 [Cercophora sp. LCS_1]